ncbi:MAG: hypothetical protein ACI4DV_03660 [Lachnospiraceae bacterium]
MDKKSKASAVPMEQDYLKAASSQDCTGLIPAAPKTEEELENYEELYPFLPNAIVSSNKD